MTQREIIDAIAVLNDTVKLDGRMVTPLKESAEEKLKELIPLLNSKDESNKQITL